MSNPYDLNETAKRTREARRAGKDRNERVARRLFNQPDRPESSIEALDGISDSLGYLRDQALAAMEENQQLKADAEAYEGMKEGVAIRIAGLEKEIEQLRLKNHVLVRCVKKGHRWLYAQKQIREALELNATESKPEDPDKSFEQTYEHNPDDEAGFSQ